MLRVSGCVSTLSNHAIQLGRRLACLRSAARTDGPQLRGSVSSPVNYTLAIMCIPPTLACRSYAFVSLECRVA